MCVFLLGSTIVVEVTADCRGLGYIVGVPLSSVCRPVRPDDVVSRDSR